MNAKISKILKLSYINCKFSINIKTVFRIIVTHQEIDVIFHDVMILTKMIVSQQTNWKFILSKLLS